ncbi:MAG: hypothetical protein OEW11_07960 [Nitrospirota bacterium]|nr:hypothetical protein [Nitrospirota bacterium]
MTRLARRLLVLLLLIPLTGALPSATFADDDHRGGKNRDQRNHRDHNERGDQGGQNTRTERSQPPGMVYDQMRRSRSTLDATQGRVFEQMRREFYQQYHEGHYEREHPTFYRRGYRTRTLPEDHLRITIGSSLFFFWDGVFFRPQDDVYLVVSAPVGARVRYLPAGYISFYLGPSRYFYVNDTFYLWDSPTREYIVVQKPRGADRAMAQGDGVSDDLFIYPAEGQSDAERSRDRYECYEWAVDETGYDPLDAAPGSPGRAAYLRALGACLEGRGYTVR